MRDELHFAQMKNAVAELFRTQAVRPPWPRMILCAIATGLPLAVGWSRGQLMLSVYGALWGYLLALNDHQGTRAQRVRTLTLTLLFLITGFSAGLWLHSTPWLFAAAFALMVYWVGILGGDGAELERAAVFLLVSAFVSEFSPPLPASMYIPLVLYGLLGFVVVLVTVSLLSTLRGRPAPDAILGLRQSFRRSFTRVAEKHIHAASYTSAVLLALVLAWQVPMERSYWIVITVLLVMRADRTQSLIITAQRLIGTAVATLTCDFLLSLGPPPLIVLLSAVLCALLIPDAIKRNYIWASFLITSFVVALLEVDPQHLNPAAPSLAFLRFKATLIGCAFSVTGTLIAKLLSLLFLRWTGEPGVRPPA